MFFRYTGVGQVAEWSKARAWKVRRRVTVSRVRIPSCPPLPFLSSLSGPCRVAGRMALCMAASMDTEGRQDAR